MRRMFDKFIAWLGSVPADKAFHFAVSSIVAVVSVAVAHLCGATPFWVFLASAIVVSGVGLAKEYLIDIVADPWDIVANYAGAVVVWVTYCIGIWS